MGGPDANGVGACEPSGVGASSTTMRCSFSSERRPTLELMVLRSYRSFIQLSRAFFRTLRPRNPVFWLEAVDVLGDVSPASYGGSACRANGLTCTCEICARPATMVALCRAKFCHPMRHCSRNRTISGDPKHSICAFNPRTADREAPVWSRPPRSTSTARLVFFRQHSPGVNFVAHGRASFGPAKNRRE